jgi:hypothetical protein
MSLIEITIYLMDEATDQMKSVKDWIVWQPLFDYVFAIRGKFLVPAESVGSGTPGNIIGRGSQRCAENATAHAQRRLGL